MLAKKLLGHFRDGKTATIELIREIVDIESPSGDIAGNNEVVVWIERKFREVWPDVTIERTFAEGFGDHVILRFSDHPPGEKPSFILGHIDTVHPIGSVIKNPTRVEDGRLYGCGSFDMKANIVIMIEVFRAFRLFDLEPSKPVSILLSCDEEVGSHSGRPLVEQLAKEADVCYVFEPSANGRIKTGRKGTAQFTLTTNGIPSHAGLEPEKGASAILEMARQIEKIQNLNAPGSGTTVNVCTIQGGTASNVIPERSDCEIDVRFTTAGEAERIEAALRSLHPFDERVKISLSGGINRPPLERTGKVVEVFEKAKSLARSFDYEIGEAQVGGASDGNFVGALGIPVLDGLGIKGDGAHTLSEYIVIDDIAPRATLLAMLLLSE